jgi:SagB-type dehydrogenase family enzyme
VKDKLVQYRDFLKDQVRLTIDFSQTDQSKGLPPPPIEKPFPPDGMRIDLPAKGEWTNIPGTDLASAMDNRRSHRKYRAEPVTLEEISFLLWATQGLQQVLPSGSARRTVPSAGCRHALETYLCVLNVTGVDSGIYRYLPLEHQLLFEFSEQRLAQKIIAATYDQSFTGKAAVSFVWTTIPYRMEWRYDIAAHKVILLDAGHVCQNLYLACEAIGAGACAIAAYNQELMDQLLRLDGQDEFTVYMASVGKV